MDGRTHILLRSLGNEMRLAVLTEIVAAGAISHRQLLERLGIGKVALSKALGDLTDLGWVVRPATNREPWTLRVGAETRTFLVGAAELAAAVAESQARADRSLAERLR